MGGCNRRGNKGAKGVIIDGDQDELVKEADE